MINREHDLPITKQAKALNISRGSIYYLPRPLPVADLAIMRRLDRLHLEFPFADSRMLRGLLAVRQLAEGSNGFHMSKYRSSSWDLAKQAEKPKASKNTCRS